SDLPALLGETGEILQLEEGELVLLTPEGPTLRTGDGVPIRRKPSPIRWDNDAAGKDGHPHFILKEILEQPEAVRNTTRDRVDPEGGEVRIPGLGLQDRDLAGLNRLSFVASGTSWHAALVGKYLIEALARVPAEVDLASEFRYRQPVLDGRVLTVPI